MPDHVAERLSTYLQAFTSPRHQTSAPDSAESIAQDPAGGSAAADPPDGPDRLPRWVRNGVAFCALLELLDPALLPRHGGTATTLTVLVPLETLTRGVGAGETPTGRLLSPATLRRLACTAGTLPAVLGGAGELLDLGRTRRIFTPAQRRALGVTQRHCQAVGCDIPATWCEAHHLRPWATGGLTDLVNAALLCSFHHHRIHDPALTAIRRPDGLIEFHRALLARAA